MCVPKALALLVIKSGADLEAPSSKLSVYNFLNLETTKVSTANLISLVGRALSAAKSVLLGLVGIVQALIHSDDTSLAILEALDLE
jgi:hypothetical protein